MNKLNIVIGILALMVLLTAAGIYATEVRTRTASCYDSNLAGKYKTFCIIERLENIESKLDELLSRK